MAPIRSHSVEVGSPPVRAVPLPTRVLVVGAAACDGSFVDALAGATSDKATENATRARAGVMANASSVAEFVGKTPN